MMRSPRGHQLTVRTPEGISFSLTLASPISRCLAWVVDAFAILVILNITRTAVGLLGVLSTDLSNAVMMVLFFAGNVGYTIFLEWRWKGQTIGKRMLNLRVMDNRGLRLTFNQIVLRNLLRAIDSLPVLYLVGGLATLLSRHAQRLGDLAANTIVIREVKTAEPDLDLILEDNRYNSLRAYPHLAARLRQQTSPEEAGLALQALLRRNELEAESRIALFYEMAAHFKGKVDFPPEAYEGVSDEQVIRNIVDVIYKSTGK